MEDSEQMMLFEERETRDRVTVKGVEYTQFGPFNDSTELVPQDIELRAMSGLPDGMDFLRGDLHSEEEAFHIIGSSAGTAYGAGGGLLKCRDRTLGCIARGHHSVLEHFSLTLGILCDRGTSHALVRHRHIAVTQGSTIYHKEGASLKVCALPVADPYTGEPQRITDEELALYSMMCIRYHRLMDDNKLKAARARDVLPTSLATSIIITTNLREWFYIQQRRTGAGDAVRMHVFAYQLDVLLKKHFPEISRAMAEWYLKHPL